MIQPVSHALRQARTARLRDIPATPMCYAANDILHREGDEARTLFIVRSGVVTLSRVGSDGTDAVVGILSAGEMFGEEFAADGVFLETATAVTDVELNAIGHDRLRPEDFAYLYVSMAERYRRFVEYSSRLATGSVLVRVAEVLSRLMSTELTEPKEDGIFHVKVTQNMLAQFANTRRETVAKALSELRHADILVTGYNSVVVLDALKLAETAEGFGQ